MGSNLATRDGNEITETLKGYATKFNLVAPTTAVSVLPEGCGITFSTVLVNADPDNGGEVYKTQGGKLALGRVALDKIAACSGVTWDPSRSGRLDNGKDARYCRFRVVGHYRSFDGSIQTVVGEKEMDLREGSPQVIALAAKRKDRDADPDKQIREMRLHIQAHAESKARLRAIRSMGIKGAYTPKELDKPFMVAKLVWTGETNDPKLRREFARMQAASMIAGMSALFGSAQLTQAPTVAQLAEASADDDDDYIDAPGEVVQTPPPPPPMPRETRQAEPPERKPEPRATAPKASANVDPSWTIPYGKSKGLKPSEASDDDLNWLEKTLGESIDNPEKSRYRASNEKALSCIVAEIERRHGVVSDDIDPDMDRGDDPNNY